ncbi:DUF4861 family protein [Echinimonas agarilytica]|uniref:DUF4861 domain-containing protein n=1 Tax=Echinimonas agarilytica TaxID=1215918 RepID=A0AA41W842_9GAMM|nr:DUF4861 family protein [Echinimonas agarilytica]MCM2680675.1 DUF4861 domain-containing protein [Echinimonas agarilytica]
MSFTISNLSISIAAKTCLSASCLSLALIACSASDSANEQASQHANTPSETKVVMAYGRHVPERKDDFTWENDKVAFRVYGPAAKPTGISSGVDAWLKKVNYSIIDKWYAGYLKGISYHEDRGEGYDPYHTGPSRGVGGSAVWIDGKPYAASNWLDYTIHENKGDMVSFTLTYTVQTPLGQVDEDKTITLKLGEQMYHVSSTYKLDGQPARLPIAIGLATHDEKATVSSVQETGLISAWEMIDEQGLGSAVAMDPVLVERIEHLPKPEVDASHIWLFTHTDAQGHLEFRAGFGWQGAGEFDSEKAWLTYLDQQSTQWTWK